MNPLKVAYKNQKAIKRLRDAEDEKLAKIILDDIKETLKKRSDKKFAHLKRRHQP